MDITKLPKDLKKKYEDKVIDKAIEKTDYDLSVNNKSPEDISEKKYEAMVARNVEVIKASHKEKGWKVITLASGDKKKEWYKYLKDNPKMDYFTNLIRGEVRAQKYADALYSYYVIASPTLYILDENKKIVANRIDAEKIPEFIEHLDKEKEANKN